MNGWNKIVSEKELILKLFRTGHLNVPERNNLPNGKVRLSTAIVVIKENLILSGWFPGSKQRPVGDLGGDYLQLELRADGATILHHNFEYSLHKYDHKTYEYSTENEGAIVFLRELENKRDLDDVPIDWEL